MPLISWDRSTVSGKTQQILRARPTGSVGIGPPRRVELAPAASGNGHPTRDIAALVEWDLPHGWGGTGTPRRRHRPPDSDGTSTPDRLIGCISEWDRHRVRLVMPTVSGGTGLQGRLGPGLRIVRDRSNGHVCRVVAAPFCGTDYPTRVGTNPLFVWQTTLFAWNRPAGSGWSSIRVGWHLPNKPVVPNPMLGIAPHPGTFGSYPRSAGSYTQARWDPQPGTRGADLVLRVDRTPEWAGQLPPSRRFIWNRLSSGGLTSRVGWDRPPPGSGSTDLPGGVGSGHRVMWVRSPLSGGPSTERGQIPGRLGLARLCRLGPTSGFLRNRILQTCSPTFHHLVHSLSAMIFSSGYLQ
jgi:hypothetical protein